MPDKLKLVLSGSVGVATYPPGATFGPRSLRDFEFVWLLAGDAEYRRDDEAVPVPQGSLLLCRPGVTDAFRWDERRRTRHGHFHFSLPSRPTGWPPLERWPLVRVPAEGDLLPPLLRHLLERHREGNLVQVELSAALVLAAFVGGRGAVPGRERDAPPPPVARALAYARRRLDEDPAAPMDLPGLAAAAGVTAGHLCRLFKTATGRSPLETVRRERLERAAVLLERSNCTVAEVAAVYGFLDPFHFSRRFKAVYGRPPRELRREAR